MLPHSPRTTTFHKWDTSLFESLIIPPNKKKKGVLRYYRLGARAGKNKKESVVDYAYLYFNCNIGICICQYLTLQNTAKANHKMKEISRSSDQLIHIYFNADHFWYWEQLYPSQEQVPSTTP